LTAPPSATAITAEITLIDVTFLAMTTNDHSPIGVTHVSRHHLSPMSRDETKARIFCALAQTFENTSS
jgi:hypothetical protein